MMDKRLASELSERIAEAEGASPAQDIEKNLRAMLLAFFDRMDLVVREDFEVQKQLLEREQARLAALGARLAELQARGRGNSPGENRSHPRNPRSRGARGEGPRAPRAQPCALRIPRAAHHRESRAGRPAEGLEPLRPADRARHSRRERAVEGGRARRSRIRGRALAYRGAWLRARR